MDRYAQTMTGRQVWTPEKDQYLREHPRQPAREAAAALGVTRLAVYTRRVELGLSRSHRSSRRARSDWASDCRTTALIADVRARFPHDRPRMTVVDCIEKEYKSLHAFAVAAGANAQGKRLLDDSSIRKWLRGETRFLQERTLTTIANLVELPPSLVRHLRDASRHYWAQRNLKALARGRLKLHRRKSPKWRWSDNMRQTMSEIKKALWADPAWRKERGNYVVGHLDAAARARLSEDDHIAFVARRDIGHFLKYHRNAKPADVFRVLSRIVREHRQRFPQSALTAEGIHQKAEVAMGGSLHTVLSVRGRPFSVHEVCTLLDLALRGDSSESFLREASLRLYGMRDRADSVARLWSRIKRISFSVLARLGGEVSGNSIATNRLQELLQRPAGRPRKPI